VGALQPEEKRPQRNAREIYMDVEQVFLVSSGNSGDNNGDSSSRGIRSSSIPNSSTSGARWWTLDHGLEKLK